MAQEGKPQREAQSMALKVRAEAGIGQGPIADVFGLLERLDIVYLRYPTGVEAAEGYAARKGGRRIVFTNSSYPRGKEYFTAAHELGHLYLDLAGDDLFIDKCIESDPMELAEARANYFAANVLMPTDAVVSYIADRIGVEPDGMTAKHAVSVQQYFRVSYASALIRLRALGMISEMAYERAKSYGGYPTLADLTRRCGYDSFLAQVDGGVHIPAGSLLKVVELYEYDKIPFGSLKYFTESIQTSPEALGLSPRQMEAGDER